VGGAQFEGIEVERGYRIIWGELSEIMHLKELDRNKMKLLKLNFKK
jgi:hypothetical protein